LYFRPRARGVALGPGGIRGDWYTRWSDSDGREHREKAGTKSEAKALYQHRLVERRQGRKHPENMRHRAGATLRDIRDAAVLRARASRRKTVDRSAARLDEALAILGPTLPASRVRPEDLERLKLKLAEGRAPATVNRVMSELRSALRLAVRSGVLDRSPFANVQLLPEPSGRTRELSPGEEAKILLALPAEPPSVRAFVAFALATGARAGELCAMQWQHVNERDGFAELRETKSGKRQHLVLSPAAIGILNGLPRDRPHVFCRSDGSPFTTWSISHHFLAAAKRAGVENARLHDCRHSYASRVRRAGADLPTLAALLRHASVKTSARYAHVSRADLRQAVAAVGSATQPAPKPAPVSEPEPEVKSKP
jgi:integrase